MHKQLFIIIILTLTVACAGRQKQEVIPHAAPEVKPLIINTPKENVLVIYYSRTGKTRAAAQFIGETLGCDILEIKDLKDRSGISGFFSGSGDARKKVFTEISPDQFDLSNYDLIFIGAPVWASQFPPAILTFFDIADFTHKNVILFATLSLHMTPDNFDEYVEFLNSKGAEVIGRFLLKTFWDDADEVREETEEIFTEKILPILQQQTQQQDIQHQNPNTSKDGA